MKRIAAIILGIMLMFTIAGCSQGLAGQSEKKPVIRGQITKITQNTDIKTVGILVEGQKEQDTQYDKASVTVKSDTKILRADSDEKLSMADLKEGMKVEVYWDGPVAESYPVQMGANVIKILK